MLGTRTFREGGVMIRWLWPLGRVWAPAIMPFALCCILYGCVLGFCTLKHLHYILWFNWARDCMFVSVVIMWRPL